jgi:pimeloyl-ACP methyl ester carboxylesterase
MLLSVEKYENFDPDNTTNVIEESYKNYPLIREKMGFFDAFYQAGRNWHTSSLPMEDRRFRNSDIPTLIFVNRYDPVTPPENGTLFMENLSQGTLLILDEGGHGSSGDDSCINQVMIDFMNDPQGSLDDSCLNLYKE